MCDTGLQHHALRVDTAPTTLVAVDVIEWHVCGVSWDRFSCCAILSFGVLTRVSALRVVCDTAPPSLCEHRKRRQPCGHSPCTFAHNDEEITEWCVRLAWVCLSGGYLCGWDGLKLAAV